MNRWITTKEQAIELRSQLFLRQRDPVGIDCETVGIDPRKEPASGPKGKIVCWSLAWDSGSQDLCVAGIWGNRSTWGILGPLLQGLPVVGHNLWGFDAHMFRKAGYPIQNIVCDTLRAHKSIINPDEEAEHGLKSLMRWWLKQEPVGSFESLFSRRQCLGEEPAGVIKSTRRKVDECTVPTVVGGAHSRLGAGTEFLPLDRIPEDYPHLLDTLYEYAVLDARAALELYFLFEKRMQETPWPIPLLSHSIASGIAPAP